MARPVVTWPPPGATAQEVVADLAVLEAALDGRGPAVAVPGALPTPETTVVPDEAAVVVATSGTTGRPKPSLLTADALRLAVAGVHEAFGGPGQSLLAVSPAHITGLAVILRNLAAGHEPVAIAPGRFAAGGFVEAVGRMTGDRRYVSLVPTQLHRLLPSRDAVAALRDLDVVMVGGAALPAADHARARALGIRIVVGYGCSETAGGCVYDGRPLPSMTARLGEEGRIHLGGPQVALGYLGRSEAETDFSTDGTGRRWFRTGDHGEVVDGRLRVLGRLDDLINTGGLKVAPTVVEDALGLAGVPGLARTMVVGVPDPEWGESVAVLAVPVTGGAPSLADVREALRDHLPSHALPRSLVLVDSLPTCGPGKPDRRRARALLT